VRLSASSASTGSSGGRQRLVVDHLGRDAAMADHQDRPEHRILGGAEDQLGPRAAA
jgi:hypothetical protein